MRNRMVRLLILVLAVCLAVPAVQAREPGTLEIENVQDFLDFAEACRLDGYSRGLRVRLKNDLDLSGVEFSGIPIFCGSFSGEGHTIQGLELTRSGDGRGLFRYLTETALVENLTVCGTVHPRGKTSLVGGIAGSSAGVIRGCTFRGTVSGQDSVGGIAGTNGMTGIIENCSTSGSISGGHFTGGIAGSSQGVIRACTNGAEINTTEQENTVEISDITIDSMVGSEAAYTATDIGGIAGSSAGVIRDCENRGNVGYPHMGYNLGGIAGSQSGLIQSCQNYGIIQGRKDVGGIVGQLEPAASVSFSEDALQSLQKEMKTMSALTGQLSSNARENVSGLNSQIADLKKHAQTADQAMDTLLPDLPEKFPTSPEELPRLPDRDTVHAAQNVLSSSLSSMMDSVSGITVSAKGAAVTLSKDLQAVVSQAGAVSSVLSGASQNLGGSIRDVSDGDTEADVSAKLLDCTNRGQVFGDRNTGGVAGTVAIENDLDHEDDLQIFGDRSLNFDSTLRAVILRSRNEADIFVKKQNGGGIVGWLSLGLVKNCENTGNLENPGAESLGGIAGVSSGFLRSCSSKCLLDGKSCLGGIAGSGTVATDCTAMARLPENPEYGGAILGIVGEGWQDTEEPLRGNRYLVTGADPGGIDGVSYTGKAEPVSMEEFLKLDAVSNRFLQVNVTFMGEDGNKRQIHVPFDGSLEPDRIPAVPEKSGYFGSWEGLDPQDLQHLRFSRTYRPAYRPHSGAILSKLCREDGRAILLAQGDFPGEQEIFLEQPETLPEKILGDPVLDLWEFRFPADASVSKIHYALPEQKDFEPAQVLVRGRNGSWRQAETEQAGSYLLFSPEEGDSAVCLIPKQAGWEPFRVPILAVLGTAVLIIILYLLRKHRKKKTQKG